jgi:hypothetical protein
MIPVTRCEVALLLLLLLQRRQIDFRAVDQLQEVGAHVRPRAGRERHEQQDQQRRHYAARANAAGKHVWHVG